MLSVQMVAKNDDLNAELSAAVLVICYSWKRDTYQCILLYRIC